MRIEVIPAKIDESKSYYDLFSSKSVCAYMDIAPFSDLKQSEDFLEFSEHQKNNKKSYRYSIHVDDKIVGTLCLYSIYWHQRRASIGYALKQEYWNKGIMKYALTEIEGYAKKEFDINRLQATVLKENINSKKLLLKRGFEYEGLLRQYEIWEGKGFVDLEMYSKIISN